MSDDILKHLGEMTTLSEVMNHLSKEGYTFDFNIAAKSGDTQNPIADHPENFLIDKFYRFEGASDPEDESILYAISSTDGKIKGLLVDGYGVSAEYPVEEIVKKIKTRTK